MDSPSLELFAGSLGSDDQVALEVSGNAWEVVRIIRPHVGRVVAASPTDTGMRQARAKTDRLDARALARLLAQGQRDGVWVPDEATQAMRRRLQRRRQLIVTRSKAKNEIHAALMRRLVRKPKVSDLFGTGGRRWLDRLELPAAERETVDGCLRQLDFCDGEIAAIEKLVAASQGFDLPSFANLTTLKIWAEEGPPKGTLYHYPNPHNHQILSVAGAPAPPKIAVQIYTQAIMTKMVVRHMQGEAIEKTLAWAESEIEGFMRT